MTALRGLRVVDASTLLSVPQIGAMLADFGADVVKIEPPGGDPLRTFGADPVERNRLWEYVNRGKSVVDLDLQSVPGRADFWTWLEWADVVIFNQSLDALAGWGLDWDTVHARCPDLVVAVVSCYGAEGPLSSMQGNGTLAEAFGGLTHMTGEADGPPMLTSIPLGDTLAAMSGAIGVLTASLAKQLGNATGQLVDVAMFEPVLQLLGPVAAEWVVHGSSPPMRRGNRLPRVPLRNLYRCRSDQWIAVSATTDRQAARLLQLVGSPAVGRADTVAQRIACADEIEAHVSQWVARHTVQEALDALHGHRVTAAPVLDLADIARHPHVLARGSVVAADGVLRVAAVPRLSHTPGKDLNT